MPTQTRNINRCDTVSNQPFRERFLDLQERGLISLREVAVRVGYVDKSGRVDTSRLARQLGLLKPAGCTKILRTGERRRYSPNRVRRISYSVAVTLCDALNMDPFEGGV